MNEPLRTIIIIAVAVILAAALTHLLLQVLWKNRRIRCRLCLRPYRLHNVKPEIRQLQWEKAARKVTKDGDEYQIEHKMYYRNVDFYCSCKRCGRTTKITKRFDLWRSDSDKSQHFEDETSALATQMTTYMVKNFIIWRPKL